MDSKRVEPNPGGSRLWLFLHYYPSCLTGKADSLSGHKPCPHPVGCPFVATFILVRLPETPATMLEVQGCNRVHSSSVILAQARTWPRFLLYARGPCRGGGVDTAPVFDSAYVSVWCQSLTACSNASFWHRFLHMVAGLPFPNVKGSLSAETTKSTVLREHDGARTVKF